MLTRIPKRRRLARPRRRGIRFLTLRRRSPHLAGLGDGEWQTIRVERSGPHPQVHEDEVTVRGLGREAPTLLITNDRERSAKQLLGRYRGRAVIDQRLAEAIRSFHLDALSSAVANS